uniref:DUF3475 domain-containing protein n=1 Tax=Syphacia muris TaxID=451379 RepID=A0A0N5AZK8_9BILA
MERKRLRVVSEGDGEKKQKFEFSDTGSNLEKRLRDNHAEIVVTALNYCKTILVSKTAVESFVNSNSEQFSAVLYAFKRAALSETTSKLMTKKF